MSVLIATATAWVIRIISVRLVNQYTGAKSIIVGLKWSAKTIFQKGGARCAIIGN